MDETPHRRAEDLSWTCRAARRASEAWDFIDKRSVDKHAVTLAILAGTWRLTLWAMDFAAMHGEKSGVDAAAIIAAVCAPYMALQAVAIKWYFEARSA